jgi:glutamine amidotransferase
MQKILIVDYGLANIKSVVNALECFSASILVSSDPAQIASADKIILPGVGSYDAGIRGLRDRNQIDELQHHVVEKQKPFLGVCLGFQLIFDNSEEGVESGLGWIKGSFTRFNSSKEKVPHIGWSEVQSVPDGKLLSGMGSEEDFYFVHSYYLPVDEKNEKYAKGISHYGVDFISVIEKDNIYGVQFHPEKSQLCGLKLIENFLNNS